MNHIMRVALLVVLAALPQTGAAQEANQALSLIHI